MRQFVREHRVQFGASKLFQNRSRENQMRLARQMHQRRIHPQPALRLIDRRRCRHTQSRRHRRAPLHQIRVRRGVEPIVRLQHRHANLLRLPGARLCGGRPIPKLALRCLQIRDGFPVVSQRDGWRLREWARSRHQDKSVCLFMLGSARRGSTAAPSHAVAREKSSTKPAEVVVS